MNKLFTTASILFAALASA
jgi:hypothetical protein